MIENVACPFLISAYLILLSGTAQAAGQPGNKPAGRLRGSAQYQKMSPNGSRSVQRKPNTAHFGTFGYYCVTASRRRRRRLLLVLYADAYGLPLHD